CIAAPDSAFATIPSEARTLLATIRLLSRLRRIYSTMSTAKRKPVLTMAQQADKHELYEEAVQAVDGEVEYLVDTFKELRGREPISFREDFCGTASAACEWVRTHPKRIAIGVDIDEETLEWGRANRVGQLPEKD